MVNITNDNISDIVVGNASIEKAILGNQLVWERVPPVLPYDSQIEYLESTGTQYIQLPLSAPARTFFGVEFEVLIETLYTNTNNSLFGGNPWRQCQVAYYSNANGNITFASFLGNSATSGAVSIAIGDKTHVIFSTTQTHSYTEDGDITNRALSRPLSAAITAFRIFRGYRYSNEYPCKIYNFKITVGDSVVYNLIPVKKDDIGYMYDKVSKQLFGNAGTGDFVLGPDVI